LMTSWSGRNTVRYLVRCALPAGHSLVKQDAYGNAYTYYGEIGLAPGWENGACDAACEQYVSACLMAHVNTAGISIPIWLDAANPAIGWGQNASYPNQEGTFFGNIMRTNPTSGVVDAYYCDGSGFNTSVVPGRLGGYQSYAPYRNYFGAGALCSASCKHSMQETGGVPDGYTACATWDKTITVWRRNVTSLPTEAGAVQFDFEGSTQGWSGPALTASTAVKLNGQYALAAPLAGAGTFLIRTYAFATPPPPGAVVTMHVWIPTVTPIASLVGEVTDGWGVMTTVRATNLTPGAWNTVTVNVPAAAHTPVNSIGIDVVTNGATVAYIDAVKW